MKIKVGDLVRVRGHDWLGKSIGIVTEVKELVHDGTGARYTAATALIDDKYFTFSEHTFELVNSAERKED